MIPKIIHQIWIGPRPVPNSYIDTWRELAKLTGWEHRLWTDAHVEQEVRFSRQVFDEWPNLHGRADLYRWEVLYRHGGVYFDADYVSTGVPLENFIPLHCDLVGTTEHEFPPLNHFRPQFDPLKDDEVPMSILLQAGFFCAAPRHPQVRYWLECFINAYHRGRANSDPQLFSSVAVAGAYNLSKHIRYPITVLPFQWLLGKSDSFARYFDKYPE